ncbi:MAG TPA: chromate efflux transporter [Gaiellaceae bacterium]|nr:chromate efflux transporter [Gaiellaceae bacterium]
MIREWGRIGCTGFGGPPTHIALLRDLCVDRRSYLSAEEFEDAIAACNLLPGPASTQLAIYCAWRVRGPLGALAGGLAFICPGLVVILALAAVFLEQSPPLWISGAAAGAGAGVAAVAVQAGLSLVPASRRRAASQLRWLAYAILGGIAAATIGPWLVLILLACGVFEIALRARGSALGVFLLPAVAAPAGGIGALAWLAIKVGLLSYGGGFVIVPLMQSDAVHDHHWVTSGQFLNAVALGQITPGPVVLTVAVIGYAAKGVAGGLLATGIAFAPSFAFVLIGGRHFDALRTNDRARTFLDGAGPAAIGAILGASIPLALALGAWWQDVLLGVAGCLLFLLRRGVVFTLLALGVAGSVLVGLHAV